MDPELRKRTRLAAFTSRDIRGEIVVGQVQRIQCGFDPVDPVPGTLSANITALALDDDFATDAIAYIRAGNGITGTITAAGSPATAEPNLDTDFASIGKLVVGPSTIPAPLGIQGGISAKFGRIGSIYSTGPISATDSPVSIVAGDGIAEIRAIDEAGASTFVPADFNVDVLANSLWLDPLTLDPVATFEFRGPDSDGVLRRLDTGGDLRGEVRAANIACAPTSGLLGTGTGDSCLSGIFVKGVVTAPINIDYHVHYGNIVARSFQAPITIGRFVKGAIVATGGASSPDPNFLDGRIPSVTIGRGELPPNDPAGVYARSGPGLCGLASLPFVPASIEAWFTQTSGQDGGAIDGLIRAVGSIGTADVASMSLRWNNGCKLHAPRIEAPMIERLVVRDLRVGSVWSGLDDADPGNDFAAIGEVDIGCLGRESSLWITGWSSARFENVFGSVHVPLIASGDSIFIEKHLADQFNPLFGFSGPFEEVPCECAQWAIEGCSDPCGVGRFSPALLSPRDPLFPECSTGVPGRGRIWVRGPLAGQIIINAANGAHTPVSDYWTGDVQVGVDPADPLCPLVTLTPAAAAPHTAPYYTRVSASLGGGAVGLAPFHFYPPDCSPPHDPDGAGDGIKFASMDGAYVHHPQEGWRGIAMARFYGPVARRFPGAWTNQFEVKCRPFAIAGLDPCAWFNISNTVTVFGPGGPDPLGAAWPHDRAIGVRAKNGYHLGPGIYMLAPKAENVVACAGVEGSPDVVWDTVCDHDYEFGTLRPAYVFVISGDCDGDDIPDQHDPDLSTCLTPCVVADFNHTGTVTVQDIFDFLTAYFAADPGADVNQSGSVTIQDIFDYLAAYFSCGS